MAGAGDLEGLLARAAPATPLRSAPTAKTNGFPVIPTAWISPASARTCRRPAAASSPAMPAGPKVFGFVWSTPLSRVSRAMVPAPPGSVTSWTSDWVTTSSGKAAVARTGASGSWSSQATSSWEGVFDGATLLT